MELGEEGDYLPDRYSHHQNDSCIKMGSNAREPFLRFINCEGQSHKTVSTN